MQFDFNGPVFDLDGVTPLLNVEIGKMLANALCFAQNTREPAKFMDWSRQLYKTGTIELSDIQKREFLEWFENSNAFASIIAEHIKGVLNG